MKFIRVIYKIIKVAALKIDYIISWVITFNKFVLNGVEFQANFISRGVPVINVNLKGKFTIGKNFLFYSGKYHNMIGRQQPCFFIVGSDAELIIGDNVGISCTALICYNKIVIGNDVKIGGNVSIYDTDFHSLNSGERNAIPEVRTNIETKPVYINDGVFIGANTTILKGVTIGCNSIVGACSVVTKNVPPSEIWAGNPAKFIKTCT